MKRLILFEKKGFSLIEVLIGLVFLAIGLLAIASLQVTSVRGNFFSHNLMQATYVAQDRLELLKNLPLNHPSLSAGNHDDGTYKIPEIPDLIFNRSYSVEALDSNGNYLITYSVRWNDITDHKISFTTIRSQ
ncbi:MAG: type IV pilus modification PilV family protein [Thermodesulfobacteriota bacterium]